MRGKRESPSSIYKSYFRTLFLSRLALLAFWACFAYFIVWAIPWIPGGLTAGDYSLELLATMVPSFLNPMRRSITSETRGRAVAKSSSRV